MPGVLLYKMLQSVWSVNVPKTTNTHARIQREEQEEQQLAKQQLLTTYTDVKRRDVFSSGMSRVFLILQ